MSIAQRRYDLIRRGLLQDAAIILNIQHYRKGARALGRGLSGEYNSVAMAEVRFIHPSQRMRLARLLDERSLADAMAAYYALHHPPDRVRLYGYYPHDHPPTGFLVMARTGVDLFRPLAIPFVGRPVALGALLMACLKSGRPALLQLPFEQRGWVPENAEFTGAQASEWFRLDPSRFSPLINVLLVESKTPSGWPRFEIRTQKGIQASAGLNWKGGFFAEVYVESDSDARGRKLGLSALAAISARLLEERKIAILRISNEDVAGRESAMELGYRATGVRMLSAQVTIDESARQAAAHD